MRFRNSSPQMSQRFRSIALVKKIRFGNCGLRRIAFALILSLAPFASSLTVADELGKTKRTDELVSKLVAMLMQRDHLSSRALDDTISQRAFDQFIKMLDPMKVYFLQSDIDEFEKWKVELDNQMLEGDFSAAFDRSYGIQAILPFAITRCRELEARF